MQKVLLPAQPSTGASPSCTSPSSSTTSVTTPTATLSTNSQTDTSPSQPYIQPPLVSVQEVQATLGKMSGILIVTEKAHHLYVCTCNVEVSDVPRDVHMYLFVSIYMIGLVGFCYCSHMMSLSISYSMWEFVS